MCGIAGRVGPGAGSLDALRVLTNALIHRGPDEDGYFVEEGVELGVRRLSIVDVAKGQQPACDQAGDIVVVFNGEIYNHQDLRAKLRANGHVFRSESDTEVIAHLYKAKGDHFVNFLRGMYAIAIWDKRTQVLLLARDRVGKKPLLYQPLTDGGLVFASEIRALRYGLSAAPSVDLASINQVLAFGYLPTDRSALANVRRLEPGCMLHWKQGQLRTTRYWSQGMQPRSKRVSSPEAVEACSNAIEDAVRTRLASERPIGAFLSGGIDSTVVTAMMVRNHHSRVSTFTVGFEDQAFDESKYARQIANYLGTDHHELILRPEPVRLLSKFADAFDEPFADSSALPTMILSEFARQHVVVALTGDGGDEAFAGYDRYRALPKIQRLNWAAALLSPLRPSGRRIARANRSRRLERLVRELQSFPDLATRYRTAMELAGVPTRRLLWTRESIEQIGKVEEPELRFQRTWHEESSRSHSLEETMTRVDFRTYLPGDLLVKVDIATMASSLEARSPLLDRKVLDVAHQLSPELNLKSGETKHILREIARQLVPRSLVDRPKMGFGIPQAEWLRGPLWPMLNDLLTDRTAVDRGWFDQSAIQTHLRMHRLGHDQDRILWPLLCVELWARRWLTP